MIIKTFDNGWGPEYPVKQYEITLLTPIMEQFDADEIKTVVINNVWYNEEFHQTVLEYLRANIVDRIVLVSMIDPAITHRWRYDEFDCEIIEIGNYAGTYEIDFWALYMYSNFLCPNTINLFRIGLVDTAYMCLNRKPHWHRRKLYNQLENLNLLDKGLVSMGSATGEPIRSVAAGETPPSLTPNSGNEQYGLPNDIVSLGNMSNWQRTFLNIVTETVYGITANRFVSEKIFKPILGLRPFLVYDTDGAHFWLTHRGFEDYTRDFSDISDLDLRNPDNIAPFLAVLCKQPKTYWQKKLIDLNHKIMYNREQFYRYVDKQRELVNKGIICQI